MPLPFVSVRFLRLTLSSVCTAASSANKFCGGALWVLPLWMMDGLQRQRQGKHRFQHLTFHLRHCRMVVDEYCPSSDAVAAEVLFSNCRRSLQHQLMPRLVHFKDLRSHNHRWHPQKHGVFYWFRHWFLPWSIQTKPNSSYESTHGATNLAWATTEIPGTSKSTMVQQNCGAACIRVRGANCRREGRRVRCWMPPPLATARALLIIGTSLSADSSPLRDLYRSAQSG